MVINLHPKLEGDENHNRQTKHHNQRQTRVNREHENRGKDDVRNRPGNVNNTPAEQLTHAFGIGGNARHNPPQGRLAEIAKREFLQMFEKLHAQLKAQFFAHHAGIVDKHEETRA